MIRCRSKTLNLIPTVFNLRRALRLVKGEALDLPKDYGVLQERSESVLGCGSASGGAGRFFGKEKNHRVERFHLDLKPGVGSPEFMLTYDRYAAMKVREISKLWTVT